MSQNTSFYTIAFSILIISIITYFAYSTSEDLFADSTDNTEIFHISETEAEQFLHAVTNNNFTYFNSIANNAIEDALKPFTHTMDFSVVHKNQYLFFSMLGLKEQSSILHNVYGTYNKNKSEITMFPPLAVSIENFNKEALTLTLKNISNTIIPTEKSLILMPQNIKINAKNEDILLPNETQKFFITKFIDSIDGVKEIESVKYGYKVKIK